MTIKVYHLVLKILKRVYLFFFPIKKTPFILNIQEAEMVSNKIYDSLISDKPCMIGRFGATESNILKNYIGINSKHRSVLDFISNKSAPWWWNKNILTNTANKFLEIKEYEFAIKTLQKGIKKYPNVSMELNIANIHRQKGETEEMTKKYIEIVKK